MARARPLAGPSGSHSDSGCTVPRSHASHAFLVIGSRNREYYRSFGVPDEKLFWAPYGVDNEWFALPHADRAAARARIRSRLGVGPDAVVIASSAKLIERKRPLDLVDAVAALRDRGIDAHALFIGDGEERDPP